MTVEIKVKNLRKAPGTFGFYMAPAGTHDFVYAAQAKRKRDGSVVTRLEQSAGHVAMERMKCNVNARWAAARDFVRISFPQACLDHVGKAELYAFAERPGWDLPMDDTDWFTVRIN